MIDDKPVQDSLQKGPLVFVLGAPRSGTTWLAKMFDSHPDVLYRHEPDSVIRDFSFPLHCDAAEVMQHRNAAAGYVQRLLGVRVTKTAGTWPVFAKTYHGALKRRARAAMIVALRMISRAPGLSAGSRAIAIPDLFAHDRYPGLRLVVKSVSSLGRAGLFATALPGSRFVVIIRHPCGYVASMLRGASLGKFRRAFPAEQVLCTAVAARYGLTPERFATLSRPEQLAWNWAINYEMGLEDLGSAEAEVRLVSYEALCRDPLLEMKALFAFAALPWSAQTAAFVERSTSHPGSDLYYGVFKKTREIVNRWRSELSLADQHAVMAVVEQTGLRDFFAYEGPTQPAMVPHPA